VESHNAGGERALAVDTLDFFRDLVDFFQVDLLLFLAREELATSSVRTSDCDVLVNQFHVAPLRFVVSQVSFAVDALHSASFGVQ